MSAVVQQIRGLVATSYAWLRVDAHRRQLYKRARVVLPLLIAGGFLPTSWTGSLHGVLTVLAILAGAAVPHLAAKNV